MEAYRKDEPDSGLSDGKPHARPFICVITVHSNHQQKRTHQVTKCFRLNLPLEVVFSLHLLFSFFGLGACHHNDGLQKSRTKSVQKPAHESIHHEVRVIYYLRYEPEGERRSY